MMNDSSMINTSLCLDGMKKKNKSYGKIITKLKC